MSALLFIAYIKGTDRMGRTWSQLHDLATKDIGKSELSCRSPLQGSAMFSLELQPISRIFTFILSSERELRRV
jgi:hypothetical protein